MIERIDAYIFRAAPRILIFMARLLMLLVVPFALIVHFGDGGSREFAAAFGLAVFAGLHYILAAAIRARHPGTLPLVMLLSSISLGMSLNSPTMIAGLGGTPGAIAVAYAVSFADIAIAFAMTIWAVYHFRDGTFSGSARSDEKA